MTFGTTDDIWGCSDEDYETLPEQGQVIKIVMVITEK